MTTFKIQSTEMQDYPILVTWSDYELDFSIHQSLDEALEFIRQNPAIESLADAEQGA